MRKLGQTLQSGRILISLKIIYIYIYIYKMCFMNLQKNRSQKLSMIEKKQRQGIYIEFRTKLSVFQYSALNFFNCRSKVKKNIFLEKHWKEKLKNQKSLCIVLCGIWCRFQNCLVFFSALIVFDFYSFENSKKKTQKKIKKISNFLENHTEIQKSSMNKKILEFNFTYAVQISLRLVHK